jgi:ABC-type nitrate/sulfonate/bicarbonate transport system substrate-binding protein
MISITKQLFVSAILIAALQATGNAAETVRLAQNLAPISGLVIIAKEQHFFEKNGLDVQVSNFSSGRQALETVLGNGSPTRRSRCSPGSNIPTTRR